MLMQVKQRIYPECDILLAIATSGSREERQEANELICEIYEAVNAVLAPEPVFSARDERWFQQGLAVEQLLRRQGLDSSTDDEISLDELSALLASERTRGEYY